MKLMINHLLYNYGNGNNFTIHSIYCFFNINIFFIKNTNKNIKKNCNEFMTIIHIFF